MFSRLSRLFGTLHGDASTPPLRVEPTLLERVERLERAEATRAGEHLQQLDRMERLYKRMSMRIAREPKGESTGESPLTLKQRLRG